MINLIVSKVIGSNDFDTSLAPLPIQKFGNLASAGSMFAFNLNNDLEKGQKGIKHELKEWTNAQTKKTKRKTNTKVKKTS